MSVETLLYVYLFICIGMIVFNVITAVVLHKKDQKTISVSREFDCEIQKQIKKISVGRPVDDKHKRYLIKKLKHIGNMLAFDKLLEQIYSTNHEKVVEYLSQLDSVFIYLTIEYSRKDRIEAAYFPYIITKYRLIASKPLSCVVDAMLDLLYEPTIYCRENAMQALYTTGDCDCIIKALRIIDRSDLFFHEKLLADGLLHFSGDLRKLVEKTKECFNDFSTEMKITLLNFMRFESDAHCAFAYSLLSDTTQNKEIRYACIRYFGKHHYNPAYRCILNLADKDNGLDWEYSAIASNALSIYPAPETTDVLKNNLYSKNWYIRFNSSQSLEKLGLTYLDLIDIMEGRDRYAAEILQYRFDVRRLYGKEAIYN